MDEGMITTDRRTITRAHVGGTPAHKPGRRMPGSGIAWSASSRHEGGPFLGSLLRLGHPFAQIKNMCFICGRGGGGNHEIPGRGSPSVA